MCLLFFSADPFILCSNRDEYFDRDTSNGYYDPNLRRYSPVDNVAGGTWIALAGKGNSRFAVVLNFHDWRYDSFTCWNSPGDCEKVSRGHLPAMFVDSFEDISARDFAHSVCADNMHGFNLIVGDSVSCHFVSNCQNDGRPIELSRSEIYGISNGYLCDKWPKTVQPVRKIESLMRMYYSSLDHDNDALGSARVMAENLADIMKDDEPKPDATYGLNISALTRLSAVNVKPLHICGRLYGTRTIIVAISIKKDEVDFESSTSLLISEHTRYDQGDNVIDRTGKQEHLHWDKRETILPDWQW